jgi:hypothetical protein
MLMGFLDYFRSKPAIRDTADLSQFVEEQAAFLVQKGIYEYSRARAGHYSKVLFAESGFHAAVDLSRWQAFPLGLAMVGELVEGILARTPGADRTAQSAALRALVLSVFDRHPTPPSIAPERWRELRSELAGRLGRIGMHPPKPAMDISEPYADSYFSLMPIHEKLRGQDAPTLRSYLRVTMCNISDELTKRIDAPAVVSALRSQQPVNAD